jgi:hypothetical protein
MRTTTQTSELRGGDIGPFVGNACDEAFTIPWIDPSHVSVAISGRGLAYSELRGGIACAHRHSPEGIGIWPKLLFEPSSSDLW